MKSTKIIQRVRKTTRFTVIHQIIYEIYKIYSEGHKEVPNKNYSNWEIYDNSQKHGLNLLSEVYSRD